MEAQANIFLLCMILLAICVSIVAILFLTRSPSPIRLVPVGDVLHTPFLVPKFNTPTLNGFLLGIVVFLAENLAFVRNILRQTNRFNELRAYHIPEAPTFFPIHYPSEEQLRAPRPSEEDLQAICASTLGSSDRTSDFRFNSIKDYRAAYESGRRTPSDVAENLIMALEQCQSLRAIVEYDAQSIRSQAAESTERFQRKQPRSLLEGIPISVKDQINVQGMSTSKGMCRAVPTEVDAEVIKRLRAAGAIIYGKANQTEMGIHVTGLNSNTRYGHCRNPYNPNHHTGGSSSGSGSAVGAGLGPVSIAADGGGSIRIPSSLCGQVGIKPTCGRVSLTGDVACFGSTVDVVGPIATTAQDLAIVMSIISDPDENDPLTRQAPPLSLNLLADTGARDLQGVRIGVYDEWINDAPAQIAEQCWELTKKLEQLGAEIVKIVVPELHLMIPAHLQAISSEMHNDIHTLLRTESSSLTHPSRLVFSLIGGNTAGDYLQSAKVRTRMIAHFKRIFKSVDLIITPANATAAPPIPKSLSDRMEESSLTKLDAIMRYMHAANLTGLPACVFPVAYTANNLPIAMQCIGNAWNEDLLLKVASLSHESVKRQKPLKYVDLLK